LIECRRQQHQQQQLERGEFSPSLSPSGLDSREPYDLNLGKLTASVLLPLRFFWFLARMIVRQRKDLMGSFLFIMNFLILFLILESGIS
jgi:hypothetical protein